MLPLNGTVAKMAMDYDLIVIGGGSGGLATAQRAVEYGARVALVEPARLGGTCVNVGCVPKKVMWSAASLGHGLADAAGYGFDVEVRGHDWGALKRGRDAYVARLNGIYAANLEKKGVKYRENHIASPAIDQLFFPDNNNVMVELNFPR